MATDLREKLTATRQRLRETAANLRKAQREQIAEATIVHRKVRCQHTEKVALAVYLLAGCKDVAAMHYVCQKRRRKHDPNPWPADFWKGQGRDPASDDALQSNSVGTRPNLYDAACLARMG